MGPGDIMAGGSSDMPLGGAAGAAGAAGAGGANACVNPEPLPKAPAKPSAGCSKQTLSEVGSSTQPLVISGHNYYVKLPTGYEPTKPYPVLYAFHPAGNTGAWCERVMGYETNGAKDGAIRVYPNAANISQGWQTTDVPFFAALHEKIMADYCVDEGRAFAAGESPGGDFAIMLGCEHGDQLRAIASCANTDRPLKQCVGETAIVLIHGKYDNVLGVGVGSRTRDAYAALNHCGSTTTPVTGYTDPLSNCVQYDCCDAGKPVYWCEHTDPEYANTYHGWPAFAGNMTWELFASF
jgi:polyhydroxybutyrate depolymerase